jgi:PAS domain S-box-containing protein
MKLKPWGIKERAVFLALAPATVIAVALTVYFVLLRYGDVDAALQNRGHSLVRQLAPAAEYGAFSGNRGELLRLVQAAAREPDVMAITIYDAAGRLLASAGNPSTLVDAANLPEDRQILAGDGSVEIFHSRINRPLLVFDDPFQSTDSPAAPANRALGSVVLEMSRANVDARKREILGVTLLATILVLVLASLLARRLVRDITEPVLALEATVARLRSGQYDARAPLHPSGTLVSLETGFNEMAAALAESHHRSASALAHSEAELARQLSFAQTLLDAQSDAGIGLMIIEHGRVVFANRAIEQTFGYTGEEMAALPTFLAIVHPDDRMRVMHNHLRRLQGETFNNHYDVSFQRKDGDYGHADLTVATLPVADHTQILCIIVDITERKQAETHLAEAHRQLLLKKEEAERASEGKSRFLAAASHDLRQPLHALTLFATELAAQVAKPRNRKLASQIVTAAGAMAELLDALLDVSRLDIRALQPQRKAVALGPLLETIADGHRKSALAKGLRLVCRPTQLWADTDPHLLRRMVGNLVSNAVRYTSKGGVLVGVRRRGGQLRIEVWDTGVGIDADHLPFVFHEFYQVGNPERDSAKGLGLGLAIVDRLGQVLQHPVAVRSREGRGSVFAITVPATEPAPPALAEPPAGLPFRAKVAIRTLDLGQCGDICNLLDAWGYERECACSDAELPAILAREPSVLICDGSLLGEVARALAATRKPPLLVVLGEDRGQVPPGLEIDGRLASPPRPARLRALLHHLLLEEEAELAEAAAPGRPAATP